MRVKIRFITLSSTLQTGCLFNIIAALLVSLPYFVYMLSRVFVPPSALSQSLYPLTSSLMQFGCVSWFLWICAYIFFSTLLWGLVAIIYNVVAAFTGGLSVKLSRHYQPERDKSEDEPVSKYDDAPGRSWTLTGAGAIESEKERKSGNRVKWNKSV
jgi:hypothetical protein